jgi:hypothetical protein
MIKDNYRIARVFDLDDTLIGREAIARGLGLVKGTLRGYSLPNLTREQIAQLDINHDRVEGRVTSIADGVSFTVHSRRNVLPGVKEELERLTGQGADIYGNTGRSNVAPWVDMTEETLRKGGIKDHFRQ